MNAIDDYELALKEREEMIIFSKDLLKSRKKALKFFKNAGIVGSKGKVKILVKD